MGATASRNDSLNDVADKLSSGVGLVDGSTFEILNANQTLKDWLNIDTMPAAISRVIPDIKLGRLKNVVTKNRKYRSQVSVLDAGIEKSAVLAITKMSSYDSVENLLVEVTLDTTKHELDALILSYQKTMENYKAQLLQQEMLTVDAVNARADLLTNMNEQLENQVRSRTSELEKAKAKLTHQANHDVLTGLPNRRLFDRHLQLAVTRSIHNGKKLAVFYLDLDHFKQVNDTLGHNIGDELLKSIANRLQQNVRGTDIVARMGGDEFCILAEDTNRESAAVIAKRIGASVAQVVLIGGHEIFVSASIGICMLEDIAGTGSSITQGADAAMYQVKSTGRNEHLFFDAKMISQVTNRAELESDLRHAVSRNELFLVYQPKLDLVTQAVTGCEALVRWAHPTKGTVPPDEFISIAEEAGLIAEIGQWVLEQAMDQITEWQLRGVPVPSVSINISGKQLENTAAINDMLIAIHNQSIDPAWLEFELTESILISHKGTEGAKFLESLKSKGHQIAIDDFGTGYSSLSCLGHLPVTAIKIDREFVHDLSNGQQHETLVLAILAIADSMQLTVIAEGIETAAQRDFLSSSQCNQGQGFLFSKPLLPKDLEEFVDKQHESTATKGPSSGVQTPRHEHS